MLQASHVLVTDSQRSSRPFDVFTLKAQPLFLMAVERGCGLPPVADGSAWRLSGTYDLPEPWMSKVAARGYALWKDGPNPHFR
jgi:hypothetical protein